MTRKQESVAWKTALETVVEQVAQDGERICEWPHCNEEANYRAPRSPRQFRPFRWFCLEHVRTYNKAWDYFAGMDADRIEAEIQRDIVWHRPSWPLGTSPTNGERVRTDRVHDPYGVFGDDAEDDGRPRRSSPRDEALLVLGLDASADVAEIKVRYKALVKEYHPDTNGGSKEAEEKFKTISAAYSYLVKSEAP